MVARPRRMAVTLLAIAASVTMLAGCSATQPKATTSPKPSTATAPATSGAKPGDAPKASPTHKTTPTPEPTPVTLSCDQLLTPQQLYSFNPNVGADPGYKPKSGSLVAKVAGRKGTACSWLNQTSKETIEFAIARPAASELNDMKDAAINSSHAVPTYGVPPQVEGYFAPGKDAGVVQVFSKGYWIVGSSPTFLEPGDPADLVADILGNLPAS
jgi:hypothetical protein